MNQFSAAGILEKNKLASDSPFLILADIECKELETIHLVRNNENITWQGNEYIRFPMELNSVTDDGKEIPQVELKVSNVGGIIEGYAQRYSGFVGAEVKVVVVHAAHLDKPYPEYELNLICTATKYNEQWVTFVLSGNVEVNFRFPPNRFMQDFCRWKFKSVRCGYSGNAEPCNGTLKTCRIPERFGGEPGVHS